MLKSIVFLLKPPNSKVKNFSTSEKARISSRVKKSFNDTAAGGRGWPLILEKLPLLSNIVTYFLCHFSSVFTGSRLLRILLIYKITNPNNH